MTTRYVGAGGNDANSGLSWALRKLTLNSVEDSPVAAGDIVYVGPGTYAETLTVDVSGTAGNPITYIADYTGDNTDGTGGIVRISGSNDNITATRTTCITATTRRNYRTFRGFVMDLATQDCINVTDGDHWIVDDCHLSQYGVGRFAIVFQGANQAAHSVTHCYVDIPSASLGLAFTNGSDVNDTGHVVQSCYFLGGAGGGSAIRASNIGGITVSNCLLAWGGVAIRVDAALAVGQLVTVNNCILYCNTTALQATTTAEFSENYNALFGNSTNRSNVTAGANSNTYPSLRDARWFFESVNGGTIVGPATPASYSPLVELNSGTGAPSTDWRGHAVSGSFREWGPEEYVSTYTAGGGGGVTMWPLSNAFIQTVLGGEV